LPDICLLKSETLEHIVYKLSLGGVILRGYKLKINEILNDYP